MQNKLNTAPGRTGDSTTQPKTINWATVTRGYKAENEQLPKCLSSTFRWDKHPDNSDFCHMHRVQQEHRWIGILRRLCELSPDI